MVSEWRHFEPCRTGMPMMINAEPMAGGTAPVTLAGTLALACAEAMSRLVIAQSLEPGRPCIFNVGFAHALDMRRATALTGSAENGLMAGAGLSRRLGLPGASWMSSESTLNDSQNALEKMTDIGRLLVHTIAQR